MRKSGVADQKKNQEDAAKPKGGRTTNSPPPNVSSVYPDEVKALGSNVDTLALSIDVLWDDTCYFEFLAEKKS
ncbi:hypothetical protein [Desulfosarcina ovata]|uniref:Uncharacterized protein n=1 Tax=Desulfosarcina ovata subsp. ovata TaxID=2752305 RepID=A0A5K8AB99_9BACT|nr:hypothetical protein [Desulfosarcina ovata]BBO89922.1 hypothetical protein DSCOOX_31020 [Desulfosarcina ovata subsp. ovata]